MTRLLDTMFLRLYAVNLARRFRNSPDAACSDALMQMGMVLAVPLGVVLVLVAAFFPRVATAVSHREAPLVIILLIFVFPVKYWVGNKFGHYRNTPEAARAFSSSRERSKTILAFVFLPIVIALMVGFIGRLVKLWV